MKAECLEITSAIKLLENDGNAIKKVVEGWSNVDLDINMSNPLTELVRNKIISEISGLKYWKYEGSPHYSAGEGFICEKHKITLTFPVA